VALVERLAYDVLDGVAGTSGGEVFSTGGGGQSDVWMQCRAHVTRRVLHRAACPESAFGTALLAAAGSDYRGLAQAIENMVRIARTFVPHPVHAEHYDGLYQRFCGELKKRGFV
jgi:sugar (pentulose or hexulose) kinase